MAKWSICVASNPTRKDELAELMAVLLPQIDKYKGQIEILLFWNNFEYSLGYLRQGLLDEARGQYLSHIDDDDMVPEDFCDTIMPLLDGVDYIGFKVDFIDLGIKKGPVVHSLKYPEWFDDETGYYRGVTHLNPVRTALARQSSFPTEYNIGEDAAWAKGMTSWCKTEHFIDREMYIYRHDGHDSVAYKTLPDDTPRRPVFASKNVRFHPGSTPDAG